MKCNKNELLEKQVKSKKTDYKPNFLHIGLNWCKITLPNCHESLNVYSVSVCISPQTTLRSLSPGDPQDHPGSRYWEGLVGGAAEGFIRVLAAQVLAPAQPLPSQGLQPSLPQFPTCNRGITLKSIS